MPLKPQRIQQERRDKMIKGFLLFILSPESSRAFGLRWSLSLQRYSISPLLPHYRLGPTGTETDYSPL